MSNELQTASGFRLQRHSLEVVRERGVAWLSAESFPALVEVNEVRELLNVPAFVQGLQLPGKPDNQRLVSQLGLSSFLQVTGEELKLLLNGHYFTLSQLI